MHSSDHTCKDMQQNNLKKYKFVCFSMQPNTTYVLQKQIYMYCSVGGFTEGCQGTLRVFHGRMPGGNKEHQPLATGTISVLH